VGPNDARTIMFGKLGGNCRGTVQDYCRGWWKPPNPHSWRLPAQPSPKLCISWVSLKKTCSWCRTSGYHLSLEIGSPSFDIEVGSLGWNIFKIFLTFLWNSVRIRHTKAGEITAVWFISDFTITAIPVSSISETEYCWVRYLFTFWTKVLTAIYGPMILKSFILQLTLWIPSLSKSHFLPERKHNASPLQRSVC
jgi:hypothetical protein